jgi:exopolysaccharide biosynthesis polyprenyl glycosylphosphotransferase
MEDLLFFKHKINYSKLKKFKKRSTVLKWLFSFLDLVIILLSYNISYYLILYPQSETAIYNSYYYFFLMLWMVPVWILVLNISNAAKIPRISKGSTVLFELVQFTILSMLVMFLLIFALKMEHISRAFVLLFGILHLLALFIFRSATYKFFKVYRASGHNTRNVIVIADATSEFVIDQILKNKEWGFRLLMIVSNSKLVKAKYGNRIKILPDKGIYNLKSIMTFDIVDEIIYCKRYIVQQEIENLMKASQEIGVVFRLQSDLSPLSLTKTQASLQNMPFLAYTNVPSNYFGIAWKTLSDITFSTIILIIISPVLLFIAILIKLSSKGPVFFKQVRVGLRGRQFYLYKFRTMVVNAEQLKAKLIEKNEMDGPVFKIKNDPRITKIGRILRKTGIDELPQLFNVLKGEMSLIGPRPPLPSEVKQYERWQIRRLSVKPGITCTWQIVPNRNSVVFDQWMRLDLAYIDNWSPMLDIQLFFKTIKTVFTGSGA